MPKSGEINGASLHRCVNCPQCGYLLDGLPQAGNCPECGFDYSSDTIVLYGVGHGPKMRGRGNKWIYWIAGCIAFTVLINFLPDRFMFSPWNGFTWILFVALMPLGYRLIARREMPDECELVLTPVGFGIREGRGEVRMTKWAGKHQITVHPHWFFSDRYVLRVAYRALIYNRDAMEFTFAANAETATQLFDRVRTFRDNAVAVMQSRKS